LRVGPLPAEAAPAAYDPRTPIFKRPSSAQRAQESRIDYLAHHDPLTSLPNRLGIDLDLARLGAPPGARGGGFTAAARGGAYLGSRVRDGGETRGFFPALEGGGGDMLWEKRPPP